MPPITFKQIGLATKFTYNSTNGITNNRDEEKQKPHQRVKACRKKKNTGVKSPTYLI